MECLWYTWQMLFTIHLWACSTEDLRRAGHCREPLIPAPRKQRPESQKFKLVLALIIKDTLKCFFFLWIMLFPPNIEVDSGESFLFSRLLWALLTGTPGNFPHLVPLSPRSGVKGKGSAFDFKLSVWSSEGFWCVLASYSVVLGPGRWLSLGLSIFHSC